MAETPNEASKNRPDTWVIAAVAAAALLCVSLVAVALAAILGRGAGGGAPVNANPVINISTAPAPPPSGIVRPSEPAKPQAVRSSAQDQRQPALPGVLATPTVVAVERADSQARPDAARAALPSPNARVALRVRGEAPSLYKGQAALPMPLRYRADADGKVESVYASRRPADKPLPPDQAYKAQAVSQIGVDLQVLDARSTATLDGFYAPEGFLFFTGKLQVLNKADAPVQVGLTDVAVKDLEGSAYLPNAELSGGLPTAALNKGQGVEARIAILYSTQSPLQALALTLPQGEVVLPLARQ